MGDNVVIQQCGFTQEEITKVLKWLQDYENGDLPEVHDWHDDIDWFDYM